MKVAICDDDQRCREQIMEFSRVYSARNQHFSVSLSAFECAYEYFLLLAFSKKFRKPKRMSNHQPGW